MKLGILGTGMMAQMALPALTGLGLEKAYLLARESSKARGEELAARFGLDGVFLDYEALLDSGIDTVYIALPNRTHFAYAKKALLAGKHVIVEKPATVTADALRELKALAEERDLALAEAMTVHFLPAYQAMKAQLDRMGKPRLAVFNFSQRSSRYDDFRAGIIRPVFDPAQAGGALLDLNVYNIHALVGLFGRPRAVRYQANIQGGVDTSGILTLEYGDFQAAALAAKDCGGPCGAVLEGEEGRFEVTQPLSAMTGFTFTDNAGARESFSFEGDRLAWEFADLRRMIETKDRAGFARLMDISLAAVELMEEARTQAGLRSPEERTAPA